MRRDNIRQKRYRKDGKKRDKENIGKGKEKIQKGREENRYIRQMRLIQKTITYTLVFIINTLT